MSRRDQSLADIFAVPAIIGALALIGLVVALLADGVWDHVGAALLAVAIVAIIWARLKVSRRSRS